MPGGTPERSGGGDDRDIDVGQVAQILGRSRSTVIRYAEAGVLHRRNVLPTALRRGRRRATWKYSLREARALREQLLRETE